MLLTPSGTINFCTGKSPPPLRALWHGKGSAIIYFCLHKNAPRRCSSSRSPARCSRCNTARHRCDRCSRCRPQAAHARKARADPRHLRFQSEKLLKGTRGGGPPSPPHQFRRFTPEKAPRRRTRTRTPARSPRRKTARHRSDRRPRSRPQAAHARP